MKWEFVIFQEERQLFGAGRAGKERCAHELVDLGTQQYQGAEDALACVMSDQEAGGSGLVERGIKKRDRDVRSFVVRKLHLRQDGIAPVDRCDAFGRGGD